MLNNQPINIVFGGKKVLKCRLVEHSLFEVKTAFI